MMHDGTTLYYLTSPATDSLENACADAERRARERGCECLSADYLHFIDEAAGFVTCYVVHTSPACPLRASEVTK